MAATDLLQQGKGNAEWYADKTSKAALSQSPPMATEVDVASATINYVGKAPIGTTSATAGWQIQKLTIDANGGVSIKWADGNDDYDNIWDDRAALSYS